MTLQRETTIRRLLEKYNDKALVGTQFYNDDVVEGPANVFSRSPVRWIGNVILGIDPSFRQGGEYGLDETIMVGSFLREIREAGIERGIVDRFNNEHIKRIRRNHVPLERVLASIARGNNEDPSTLEGIVRRNGTLNNFVKTFPGAYGKIEVVPQELVGRFRTSIHNQPRSMVMQAREAEKGEGERRRSNYQQVTPNYPQQRRTTARPAQSKEQVVRHLTTSTLGAFPDFTKFLPPSSSTNYTTVVGLLEAIVRGIERLPNYGTRLQETSRLLFVTHNARNSIMMSEGSEKWAGVPEYVAGLSSNVDTVIGKNYVPLERVVAKAMEGLGLEARIKLELQGQVNYELSRSANVVTVWRPHTGKESLYVNWLSEDSMVRTARRIVGEKAAKPLYRQGDYAAVQQLLKGSGGATPELAFIRVTSSYRLALVPPISNKGRGRSLGSLEKAIGNYCAFLQRHPQEVPGFEAELQEDMRRGEEFLAQIRQQKSQPKEYVRSVEAVFRDSKFMSYAHRSKTARER